MAASHLNKILSRKELIDVFGTDADVLLAHQAVFLRMNSWLNSVLCKKTVCKGA